MNVQKLINEINSKIEQIPNYTDEYKVILLNNSHYLESIYLFGYVYEYDKNINETIINKINSFIKTGVLINNDI